MSRSPRLEGAEGADDNHKRLQVEVDNLFDQLKSIKPFTVEQLFSLHPDVTYTRSQASILVSSSQPGGLLSGANLNPTLHQNLREFERLRCKLSELREQVKQLNEQFSVHIHNAWLFSEKTIRKIGMCQQGKIVETNFKYRQASINRRALDSLALGFEQLAELISREYIYYSYESQARRLRIIDDLAQAYQSLEHQQPPTSEQLKSTIVTLIDFIKLTGRSDFISQCRNWLRFLIRKLLSTQTTDNYRWTIAQLCRGPVGIADWTSDLIECKPADQVSGFESTPQYITHCCALLNELFNNLKGRRNHGVSDWSSSMEATTSSRPNINMESWSLIDPRFNCSEEVSLATSGSVSNLCESDILKLCLRIPVVQIFRAYVKECLNFDSTQEEPEESQEFIMLRLLTIGTIIIKTYQYGLETFNSIQFGNLIEYLSSQIRRTVIVLSDQWIVFKRQLNKQDDIALLLRLQVEYDNFILRSVLIILELRQSGLWKHLSSLEQEEEVREPQFDSNSWSTESLRPAFAKLLQVTGFSPSPSVSTSTRFANSPATKPSPSLQTQQQVCSTNNGSLTYGFSVEWFKEVSESMLWHMLWQFYHSAFVSLCDYHSDNYWLEKFREKSSVYLFIKKIKDSSISECHYLLNSITSMLLSRTRHDSKIVSFIASEMFNMSFKNKETKDKISKLGSQFLTKSAEEFPGLISMYINYMIDDDDFGEDIVDLFRGCSLVGWLCNEDEVEILAKWLIEFGLTTPHNKVARLIITKLFLNSPTQRSSKTVQQDSAETRIYLTKEQRKLAQSEHCFIDLKLRRKLALVLYEASSRHLPKNNELGPQSLGTFVEVALGNLYCDKNQGLNQNLLHTATETNYQQLYVWIWRLIFTFRLHILNQPETDWNDIQARSGTSRSIKNTVLVDDSFHPVPSLQDTECLSLSEGVKSRNPVALFVYLLMTDVSWQPDALDLCIDYLNAMVDTGHITPSLLAMKFFVICHLNELCNSLKGDPRYLHYFTRVIESSFDLTRFASLIRCQMQNVKQYRQLQLSQFYVSILLEIAANISRQFSSSWFQSDEFSLEKIASLLDYIAKFSFSTQRAEIIKKFHDCSFSVQCGATSMSWFSFPSNSLNVNSTRREFFTILHVLNVKFKKNIWLRWVTAECDTLRLEKIWEEIVVYLSTNENSDVDSALKKVCPQYNPSLVKSLLPIYSWIQQIFNIVESDPRHPLCPLVWYNFFLNYFANSLNGVSVGVKIVPPETLSKLLTRLDSLYQYHLYKHRTWTTTNGQQNSLAQLYRAYKLWIQTETLQDTYVDVDRLGTDFLVPLLKSVMEFSNDASACIQYMDIQTIENQNKNLCSIWLTSTNLDNTLAMKEIAFIPLDQTIDSIENVDEEASDAVSLINKPFETIHENKRLTQQVEKELEATTTNMPLSEQYETVHEMIDVIKRGFQTVLEESSQFKSNIYELDKIKGELAKLVEELYSNKKREIVRFVACTDESYCSGPGRITLEIEEATIDDRKSECIQDGQKQAENIVNELLLMPTNRAVKVSQEIEFQTRLMMQDSSRAKLVIETLLGWICEPDTYKQLNGPYYTASNLLKSVLEILASSSETDTYNSVLINVCSEHPGSVHIFSPHLAPGECSDDCFLRLYEKVCSRQMQLGPMATFVLLTKFDLDSWLKRINSKEKIHDLIRITCSALKEIGKHPDESYITTFDLYKRHIQIELAPPDRRRPEEIILLLQQFLDIMNVQRLEPALLMEFMTILGLEKQPQNYQTRELEREGDYSPSVIGTPSITSIECCDSLTETLENVIALAENQRIFDYKSLNELVDIVTQIFKEVQQSSDNITLLEVYKDYVNQLGIVLVSISAMWLKCVSHNYHNNHQMIWDKFMKLWHDWVFLDRNCQNVGKSSYSLIAYLYSTCVRYMILKMPDNTRLILQSVISTLTSYVASVQEVVYLELTILQRCLKNMPWSNLSLSSQDFENIALLSEQKNYNTSELVSHILLQVNIRDSLAMLDRSDLPRICEKLATTIVLQSSYLKSFRLHGNLLTQVPVDGIKKIAELILSRMEFVNLEHSQTNKLLVNLLRFICIKLDMSEGDTVEHSEDSKEDSFNRSVIYAQFVSDYLISLIKNHPTVLERNKAYLCAVMENSLQDLRILISSDTSIERKTTIYGSLLECCSSVELLGEVRLFIAKSLIESDFLKNRPIVVIEIFHALGQILRDGRVLVYSIERMIGLYMNMNGHYEKVWKSFSLRSLPSDIYLEACIQEMTPLALLAHFESSYRGGHQQQVISTTDNVSFTEPLMNSNEIWSSFFHWVSKISVILSTIESKSAETRLVTVWLRILDLLKQDLTQFILNSNHQQTTTIRSMAEDAAAAGGSTGSGSSDERNHHQPPHLTSGHRALLEFMEQLVYLYDKYNSGGFWSYIKSSRSEYSARLSIVALSVASFLSNRAYTCSGGRASSLEVSAPLSISSKASSNSTTPSQPPTAAASPYLSMLRQELGKLRVACLSKLESARKLKHYLNHAQFIEALIESANRNDKVQYSEAVLLMINFVKSVYEPVASADDMGCLAKILSLSR